MRPTVKPNSPQRIALVSYHFYNVTAAGQSTAKVARALTDAGHHVTVVIGCNNWFEDDQITPEDGPVAGVEIHRVAPDPVPGWWQALEKRDGTSWLWGRLAAVPNWAHGCRSDEHAWVTAATRQLRQLHDARPFDVLVTRLNHFTSHLVGLAFNRGRRRIPWCAYFSDPWPFQHYPLPYRSSAGRLLCWRLDQRLDAILKRADVQIYPSEHQRDHQLAGARQRFRERAVIAPHIGNVWHTPRPKPRGARLRILHAGFLMQERRIEPLLDGVRRLLERKPSLRSTLEIGFVGRYAGNTLPEPPADLLGVIAFHRFERPDAVWDTLQAADVLLLVEADMKLGIFFPSKLADYLGAERPILALSPDQGVARDLIDLGRGVRAPPGDPDAIAAALEVVADAWEQNALDTLRPTDEQLAVVSPSRVAACYAEAFNQARARAGARR